MPNDKMDLLASDDMDLLGGQTEQTPQQQKHTLWQGLGAEITPQMQQSNPYLSAIAKTGQDLFAAPAHMANQIGLNFPRALANKYNIEYPEIKDNPIADYLTKGFGLAGATKSPLSLMTGGLTNPAAKLGAKVLAGAKAGAIGGAAYTPTEDILGLKQRGIQATGGSIFGAAIPLVTAGISGLKDSFVNIGKGPEKIKEAAQLTYDGAVKLKDAIKEDFSVFRDSTKDTKIKSEDLQKVVDNMFPKAQKIAGEQIPQAPETQLIIPDDLKKELRDIFNKKNINLGTVYDAKDAISKNINNSTWSTYKIVGKVNPTQEHLAKAYFALDELINKSLKDAGMTEEKQMLDYLNQKASNLYGISQKMKGMVYDKTLKTHTKTAGLFETFFGDPEKNAGNRDLFNNISTFEDTFKDVIDKMGQVGKIRQSRHMLKWAGITGASAVVGGGVAGEVIHQTSQR
jgi:hypothetical protein